MIQTRQSEDGTRHYLGTDGEWHPSVTTILSAFAESDWSDYRVRRAVNGLLAHIKSEPKMPSERKAMQVAQDAIAADRGGHLAVGTELHNVISGDMHIDDVLDPRVQRACESYQKFQDDVRNYDQRFEVLAHELQVTGWTADGFGYGGTVDMVARIESSERPARIVMIEVKTSRELQATAALQVAAYAKASHGFDLDEVWVLKCSKYWVGYEVRVVDVEAAWSAFTAACELYRIKVMPQLSVWS